MKSSHIYYSFIHEIESALDCSLNSEWAEKMELDFREYILIYGLSEASIQSFIKIFNQELMQAEARAELQEQEEEEDA